jgi:predicted ATP-grasp superfamily ATP-dependent carboligase
VIAGVSARAAAESAARAGFDVTAIDAFADLDQHPSVRSRSIPRPFTARAAARAARSIACDAAAYLSNFENHPDDVRTLAAGRQLWGNPPAVLRRVRDPMCLARALRDRGIAGPEVRLPPARVALPRASPTAVAEVMAVRRSFIRRRKQGEGGRPDTTGDVRHPGTTTDHHEWLVKPLASGGGHAVRPWHRGMPVPRDCYLQELIAGTPGSIVFVAAAGRAAPLGVSHQLIGDRAFGATGYQYCGNILASAREDDALVDAACTLARAVSEEFGLAGVNGIDFVARDAHPYAVEVNPRWTASMELVERAYGLSVFASHAAACADGTLPDFDVVHARRGPRAAGKAVVFAREDVTIGDTYAWIGDATVRDVPHPGERIRAGRPVCTVFAAGDDRASCYVALVRRADRVYAELAGWKSGGDGSIQGTT